ncbi:hypothetical protein BT93_J0647 [Corymbia citriodora subsp. variegata]|nr:hypothetical protein BT93_J0647 [Corymbia citriodora subsp. variegata]
MRLVFCMFSATTLLLSSFTPATLPACSRRRRPRPRPRASARLFRHHDSQQFHWRYTELDDRNYEIQGHTLYYVVVLFAAVLLVALLFLYTRWACRCHSLPPETAHGTANAALPRPQPGLDASAIGRLPIVLHGGEPPEAEEAGECSICLGAFEDGEKVKVLPPCGHRYHCACVDQWLVAQPVCPLCRAPLRVDSAGSWV